MSSSATALLRRRRALADATSGAIASLAALAHALISSFVYFYVYSSVRSRYSSLKRRRLAGGGGGGGGGGAKESASSSTSFHDAPAATRLALTAFAAAVNTCFTLPLDAMSARKQAGKASSEGDDGGDREEGRADGTSSRRRRRDDGEDSSDDGSEGFLSFESAHESLSEGGSCDGGDDDDDDVDFTTDRSPRSRGRLYIKSPEKYKFSFSTNLAEEAFAAYDRPPPADDNRKGAPGWRRKLRSLLSLWDGLLPAILLCSNPAIQYTAYDALKGTALRRPRRGGGGGGDEGGGGGGPKPRELSAGEAFLCGMASKFVATIVTYPLIRAKIMLME
ncbi:hypothetical protein ACHAWF_011948 [Thalassiosira exigua]